MMRRERPTTDAPFLRHAACAARLDMRFAVYLCGLPCGVRLRLSVCLRLRHAVRLHSCSQPGLRHPAVWACGREEVRAEVGILSAAGMLLGTAGMRPQRRALRLCVCLRLRHAVRLHSCSQPGLRCPAVWACGCEEARAEVGILFAAGCCSVRRGCGRRGGIRRLRSAPRNSIRAFRRRGCRPRKRRRGRRRHAVQRS